MEITRVATDESQKGNDDHFRGAIRVDRIVKTPHDPARTHCSYVTFEPGSRTAWHTHPLGQILVITAGCGWVKQERGKKKEVHPGDVVWIPPDKKHWHGATAETTMTHIAIHDELKGNDIDWLKHVTDEEYLK
jgi:quercetin dioxygenase-like cupin family protein